MSGLIIAFLSAISGATWVYTYFMRTTGSNTKNSLVAAGVVGLMIFIIVFVVFSLIS